ncbi:hypothetical protein LXL04_032724 [Taraxacum kok-saghyz]
MAEAATEQIHTFTVTVKCPEGNCEKIAKQLVKKYIREDKKEKQKSGCCRCAKEKKHERKYIRGHKSEAYKKTEVDKSICRDIFCKSHYQRPIILPSSSNGNLPLPPPFFPPPYMGSYDSMYIPPPSSYDYPTYRFGW